MSDLPKCPACNSEYTYQDGTGFVCSECGHEFQATDVADTQANESIKDSNGNILNNGDNVTIIKDLTVKGMPKPIKSGTKVKNIKLVDGSEHNGHDISAKVDGFGQMFLKSSVVKKN
jgi:protein PhnA